MKSDTVDIKVDEKTLHFGEFDTQPYKKLTTSEGIMLYNIDYTQNPCFSGFESYRSPEMLYNFLTGSSGSDIFVGEGLISKNEEGEEHVHASLFKRNAEQDFVGERASTPFLPFESYKRGRWVV